MTSNGLKYYRGGRDSYEAVEGDITRSSDGTYITTCVVNIYLLISGISSHPCGNGDDYTLTPEQQLKVLEFVQAKRKMLTDRDTVKTLDGWHESGLPTFEDYCFPGDTVDQAIVNHFVNSVPPLTLRSDCTQAGEAYDTQQDPDTGQWRSTYTTFSRLSSSSWRFEGYCFKGQTNNRVEQKTRLERRIEELRREVRGNG